MLRESWSVLQQGESRAGHQQSPERQNIQHMVRNHNPLNRWDNAARLFQCPTKLMIALGETEIFTDLPKPKFASK